MPPGQLSAIQVHEVSEYIHFLRGILGAVILLFWLGNKMNSMLYKMNHVDGVHVPGEGRFCSGRR